MIDLNPIISIITSSIYKLNNQIKDGDYQMEQNEDPFTCFKKQITLGVKRATWGQKGWKKITCSH